MSRGEKADLLSRAGLSDVSMVIPAHNEEDNVDFVLAAATKVLDQLGAGEVILVDNSSTDRTAELAGEWVRRDLRVRLMSNTTNLGAAPSMLVGFLAAKGGAAMFLPADRQIMPDQLLTCLQALPDVDIVCTHRVQRSDPRHRRAMALGYNWLVRRLFHLPLHDVDSSFLVRREVLQTIAPSLTEDSGFIPVELLVRAMAEGYVLKEVPIEHHPRVAGEQEGVRAVHTVGIFVSLGRFWLRSRRIRTVAS